MPDDVDVRDEAGRYAAYLGERQAGTLLYRRRPGVIVLIHTEVEPAFEGHGVGSALARHALDEARAQGLRVDARCPFVHAYIQRHPEHAQLAGSEGARPERPERDQA